ncbi:MAG: hypothetical protein ACRCUJ_14440 [Phocaeicola sp.]
MGKQIYLDIEKKKEIAKTFKVTRQTVWYALNFKTKGGMADMLRAAAMQRGGVLLNCNGGFEPNVKFDTYFNEVPHEMVQVFSPRVRIVADLSGGGVVIKVDSKEVKSFGNVLISELAMIQAEAQVIVNNLK